MNQCAEKEIVAHELQVKFDQEAQKVADLLKWQDLNRAQVTAPEGARRPISLARLHRAPLGLPLLSVGLFDYHFFFIENPAQSVSTECTECTEFCLENYRFVPETKFLLFLVPKFTPMPMGGCVHQIRFVLQSSNAYVAGFVKEILL